jgi:hypothetical protein
VNKTGAGNVSYDLSARQHLDMLLYLKNVNDLEDQGCLGYHHRKEKKLILDEEGGDIAASLNDFHSDT